MWCKHHPATISGCKRTRTHLQVLEVRLLHLVVKRDAGGLDRDATILLVLPRVREPGIAGLSGACGGRGFSSGCDAPELLSALRIVNATTRRHWMLGPRGGGGGGGGGWGWGLGLATHSFPPP